MKNIDLKKSIVLLILILVILVIGWSYFSGKNVAANPNLEAQKEAQMWISAVGKLIELPSGETPTVATISDKNKLADQTFFKMTENGDVLFVYAKAMEAILYRPSINKIINVAPISINQTPSVASSTITSATSVSMPLRIAYYNGTDITGLAKSTDIIVVKQYPNSKTISLTDASRSDYAKTLVVDLSNTHSKEAGDIATLLNGAVGPLPKGEIIPDADILIISGQ